MSVKFKIAVISGARPNFIKVAPLMKELNKYSSIKKYLMHTGQHYDYMMSAVFFKELGIPRPDSYLGVKESNPLVRINRIVSGLEAVFDRIKPDMVIVVGDVDSTFAAGLTAYRKNIKLAHVEAGLRSYNMKMPEEANRVFVDRVSDFLFAPTADAVNNLIKEGLPKSRVFLTGNIMIDTLKAHLDEIKTNSGILNKLSLSKKDYCLLTLHRAENIDAKEKWMEIISALDNLGKYIKIVYPVHPHSQKTIAEFSLWSKFKNVKNLAILPPVSYLNFLRIMFSARFVFTDSGGVQEESSFLDIPCLTLREETERPITIKSGTNILTGLNRKKILYEAWKILDGNVKHSKGISLWDGKTAKRVIGVIVKYIEKGQ